MRKSTKHWRAQELLRATQGRAPDSRAARPLVAEELVAEEPLRRAALALLSALQKALPGLGATNRTPRAEEPKVHETSDADELGRRAESFKRAQRMQDVTNLKRVEQELRKSQESLARAQRIGHVGHWEWDAQTNLTTWSDECYRIFGLTPREGPEPGSTLAEVVPPEEMALIRECFTSTLREGKPFRLEHCILRPSGEMRMVCVEAEVTRDEAGRPIGMLGVVQDITERHRLAREREELLDKLARERRWLEAVFDSSPIGIQICEAKEPRRAVTNRAGLSFAGLSFEEASDFDIVRQHITFPDGSPLGPGDLSIEHALRGETIVGRELLTHHRDGRTIHGLVNASPVVDEAGEIQGAVAVFIDISPLKDLERMREEWTSIVAHDLKQPLTTILATASHLSRRAQDEGVKHKAERIEAATQRLIRLVADLSDLSRLSAQRLQLVTSDTDVAALIARTIDNQPDEDTRARISFTVRHAIPSLRVDQQRIEQVLENLLSNAVKYGAPATQIGISLERLTEEIMVRVTNAGDGIPADLAPRLFERFQRANRSAQRIQGTGLGLYICRGLIEAHGGHIGVESVPGQTTTFWFTLPIPS